MDGEIEGWEKSNQNTQAKKPVLEVMTLEAASRMRVIPYKDEGQRKQTIATNNGHGGQARESTGLGKGKVLQI